MTGVQFDNGPNHFWVDTTTGTFGRAEDLLLVAALPEDFDNLSDGQRIQWAIKSLDESPTTDHDNCETCGHELLWDNAEGMKYCPNTWEHG